MKVIKQGFSPKSGTSVLKKHLDNSSFAVTILEYQTLSVFISPNTVYTDEVCFHSFISFCELGKRLSEFTLAKRCNLKQNYSCVSLLVADVIFHHKLN